MGADLRPDRGAEERRAFRAFVKMHHPDAGGDQQVFVAGLRDWQSRPALKRTPDNVVFHQTQSGGARLLAWLPLWGRRPSRRRPRTGYRRVQ